MSNKRLILLTLALFIITINILVFSFAISSESQEEILNSGIREEVYVVPYIGDIDGGVSEDWFYFYEEIIEFHEENEIPVSFSFYPASIQDDKKFNKLFLEMYESENIELIQKGFRGDELEKRMDRLSFEMQKSIIKSGQDHFRGKMKEISKRDYVELPVVYNQIGGRINNDTRKALEQSGFEFYFDVFVEEDAVHVLPSDKLEITEYGVGFTISGSVGRAEKFRNPESIFNEISNFSRDDVKVMIVNGKKVIPLWAHQQDFESAKKENEIDKEKWKIYKQVLIALSRDPNVQLATPSEIYKMKHSSSGEILRLG